LWLRAASRGGPGLEGSTPPNLASSEPIPTAAEVHIQFLGNQPKADRLTHPREGETLIAVTRTWAPVVKVARSPTRRTAGKRFFIVINESGQGVIDRERPDGNDSVVRSEKNRGVDAGAPQLASTQQQLKGNGDDPNIQAEL